MAKILNGLSEVRATAKLTAWVYNIWPVTLTVFERTLLGNE